jgi:hypothetical protein
MKQGIDRNRQKDVFLFMGLNPKWLLPCIY